MAFIAPKHKSAKRLRVEDRGVQKRGEGAICHHSLGRNTKGESVAIFRAPATCVRPSLPLRRSGDEATSLPKIYLEFINNLQSIRLF